MNKTAYLVGVLDISAEPPVFIGADIFSESGPTLGAKRFPFTILEVEGDNYGDAMTKLKDYIETGPYAWCRKLVR